MAANNRGTMRPQSRSPPFLAIGLFVALCILGFNYWSLSARNGELQNEVAVMESELRLVNAKKTSAEKRSEATLDKVKELEEYLAQEKAKFSAKEAQYEDVEVKFRYMQTDFTNAKSEKDDCLNNVKVCEEQNKALVTEMESLKVELEKLKNTPAERVECTESTCAQFVVASREKLLQEVESAAGIQAIQALSKAGFDIGSYVEKVKLLDSAAAQQPQQADQAAPQDGADQPQVPGGPIQPDGNKAVEALKPENAENGDQPQDQNKQASKTTKADKKNMKVTHTTISAVSKTTTVTKLPVINTTNTARDEAVVPSDQGLNGGVIGQMAPPESDNQPLVNAGNDADSPNVQFPPEDQDENREEEEEKRPEDDEQPLGNDDNEEEYENDDLDDLDEDNYEDDEINGNIDGNAVKIEDDNIEEMRQGLENNLPQ